MPRRFEITLLFGIVWFLVLSRAPMIVTTIILVGATILAIDRHVRWRFLPTAILEVDGKTVEYHYHRKSWDDLACFHGKGHSYSPSYFLLCKTAIDRSIPIVALPVVQAETTVFEATLTLEGESYDLSMLGGFGRCPCSRKTPCWTGQIYVSDFALDQGEHRLGGQIVFVDRGQKPKRKRRKLKFKKINLPAWRIFPDPAPHPS